MTQHVVKSVIYTKNVPVIYTKNVPAKNNIVAGGILPVAAIGGGRSTSKTNAAPVGATELVSRPVGLPPHVFRSRRIRDRFLPSFLAPARAIS